MGINLPKVQSSGKWVIAVVAVSQSLKPFTQSIDECILVFGRDVDETCLNKLSTKLIISLRSPIPCQRGWVLGSHPFRR